MNNVNQADRRRPAITVLMSVYNGARWLDEAISSVLDQTFRDFEYIIIDDGSTDNSLEIIKHYAEHDSRIVVLFKNNTGLTDSLNRGIEIARSKWIARLDADDICEPTRFEKQLALARNKPEAVFIGSDLMMIDENSAALKTYSYPICHKLLVKNLCASRKFPPHSSAFYRTDIVRSIGGYRSRIKMSQDEDLWLRLSEVGQLTCVDEQLVRVRQHPDQISHDKSDRRQRIYSGIAITSYWLRHYGYNDPVSADEKTFEDFRHFLTNKLENERLHDYLDYIADIKIRLAKIRKHPSGFPAAVKYIFSKPFFIVRYIRVLLFGENVTCQAAQEWVKKQCSNS